MITVGKAGGDELHDDFFQPLTAFFSDMAQQHTSTQDTCIHSICFRFSNLKDL